MNEVKATKQKIREAARREGANAAIDHIETAFGADKGGAIVISSDKLQSIFEGARGSITR